MTGAQVQIDPPEQTFANWLAAWGAAQTLVTVPGAEAQARQALVDTVACMLGGRTEPQARAAIKALEESGEAGGSVPVGGGPGLTLGGAALINGIRAHALDFDDCETAGSTHPSAAILGAILAISSSKPLSLGAVLEAWAVGYETIVRLGQALGYGHYRIGWHATATLGTIGAAAASARALGLDAKGMRGAMTLATSSSAGLKLQFGSDAKALHAGQAAQAGLRAALLARAGMTAAADIFEAPNGFFDVYGTTASRRGGKVMAEVELGAATRDFPVLRKAWPSCGYTHRAIEAAELLAAELRPEAGRIAGVRVLMPEPYARVAGFPGARTAAEARFSTAYCVSATLVKGRLGLRDFWPEALSRPDVQDLTSRVVLEHLPASDELEDMSPKAPDTVEVQLSDGRKGRRTIAEVRGGPTRPLTAREIVDKFRDCGGSAEMAEAMLLGERDLLLRDIGIHRETRPA